MFTEDDRSPTFGGKCGSAWQKPFISIFIPIPTASSVLQVHLEFSKRKKSPSIVDESVSIFSSFCADSRERPPPSTLSRSLDSGTLKSYTESSNSEFSVPVLNASHPCLASQVMFVVCILPAGVLQRWLEGITSLARVDSSNHSPGVENQSVVQCPMSNCLEFPFLSFGTPMPPAANPIGPSLSLWFPPFPGELPHSPETHASK